MRRRTIDEPKDIQKIELAKQKAIKKVSTKFDDKIKKLNEKYQRNAINIIKILNADANKIENRHDNWLEQKPKDFKETVARRWSDIGRLFIQLDNTCQKNCGRRLFELNSSEFKKLLIQLKNNVANYTHNLTAGNNQMTTSLAIKNIDRSQKINQKQTSINQPTTNLFENLPEDDGKLPPE